MDSRLPVGCLPVVGVRDTPTPTCIFLILVVCVKCVPVQSLEVNYEIGDVVQRSNRSIQVSFFCNDEQTAIFGVQCPL
jgi:hypothetical protein